MYGSLGSTRYNLKGERLNMYGSVRSTRYRLKSKHLRVCRVYKVQFEGLTCTALSDQQGTVSRVNLYGSVGHKVQGTVRFINNRWYKVQLD